MMAGVCTMKGESWATHGKKKWGQRSRRTEVVRGCTKGKSFSWTEGTEEKKNGNGGNKVGREMKVQGGQREKCGKPCKRCTRNDRKEV